MGYTTEFTGHVTVDPPLNEHEAAYLRRFAETRRMHRSKGQYYTGTGPYGQDREPDIIDYDASPEGQPGLWCNWVPTKDNAGIEWDGTEKFYDADEWMAYLIDTFLKSGAALQSELASPVVGRCYAPEFEHFTFDHTVGGEIHAAGEHPEDRWRLVVTDNAVEHVDVDITDGDPADGELAL